MSRPKDGFSFDGRSSSSSFGSSTNGCVHFGVRAPLGKSLEMKLRRINAVTTAGIAEM